MPRRMYADASLDALEDEVLFTIAALKADPDAEDLVPLTDGWLDSIDAVRASVRTARAQVAETDARRKVANERLDRACTAFGDELWLAVGKDRGSSRWRQFFSRAVSRFVRMGLRRQVESVKGWLASTDEMVQAHRPTLEQWSIVAAAALEQTGGLAIVRGEARQAREGLADDLTRARDGLRDALAARARDRHLPRAWPDWFFRVDNRRAPAPPDETPTEE